MCFFGVLKSGGKNVRWNGLSTTNRKIKTVFKTGCSSRPVCLQNIKTPKNQDRRVYYICLKFKFLLSLKSPKSIIPYANFILDVRTKPKLLFSQVVYLQLKMLYRHLHQQNNKGHCYIPIFMYYTH